jgi:hypothetical protein
VFFCLLYICLGFFFLCGQTLVLFCIGWLTQIDKVRNPYVKPSSKRPTIYYPAQAAW